MNNFIAIDGASVWLVILTFAGLFAGFIWYARLYLNETRKNDFLSRKISELRLTIEEQENELYKAKFKAPEIGEGK